MNETLLVGTAQRDITPPAGKPMAAFPRERDPVTPRIAEGAHDPLWVRALALSDGRETVVVCSADVITFQWPDVDRMRRDFADRTGLSPESLLPVGTHNHNGPECMYVFGGNPKDDYIDMLRIQVVDAACEALDRSGPAAVSAASVDTRIAYNRRRISPDGRFRQRSVNEDREPIGPTDPKVTVIRFDRPEGPPVCAVLHFAAHPVILTTPNTHFTAEYPGALLRHFQEMTGLENALFLQGACGDTHPFLARADTLEAVEEMGLQLADAARTACEQASREQDLSLSIRRWDGSVPNRCDEGLRVRLEIAAVRLSPRLALVFLPGEPFVELSLSLQWRSPFARTVVVGYALGSCGYVPNRQAYENGGYGVDLYTTDPAEFSRTAVPPGTGERFVDEAVELLQSLEP
ncbi:MAG: hypothetical protein QGI83_21415 [Candidatus Latescibacteria bacterium]|nr:hypothetical protein [Candidatus Latescibacterota bacterium]